MKRLIKCYLDTNDAHLQFFNWLASHISKRGKIVEEFAKIYLLLIKLYS